MSDRRYPVQGAGLGLRRDLLDALRDEIPGEIDFMEVAPENWLKVGGYLGKQFRDIAERVPVALHGLSLSIGSPSPLDEELVRNIKRFMNEHHCPVYTEHLSYCSDDGHLYDLMPIPFTEEAVRYVAGRICRVQDILERRIAMENVSYYAAPGQEMKEIDFIRAVIEEADCDLHLDVNNIYVNSINHGYNAEDFLRALPGERIVYCHVAGHYTEADDLLVDTHGADVIDPVWKLLEVAYETFGVFPTLLERDFNIPPLEELLREVRHIHSLQNKWRHQLEQQPVAQAHG
jgi:hypothetical protein